jgi:hypothetical protein
MTEIFDVQGTYVCGPTGYSMIVYDVYVFVEVDQAIYRVYPPIGPDG